MKKVFRISVNGRFKQYLLISEAKYIREMCENWGEVTVEIVELSPSAYKIEFGL